VILFHLQFNDYFSRLGTRYLSSKKILTKAYLAGSLLQQRVERRGGAGPPPRPQDHEAKRGPDSAGSTARTTSDSLNVAIVLTVIQGPGPKKLNIKFLSTKNDKKTVQN